MKNFNGNFFGDFSGRVGNVVVYNWRGFKCIRSMPAQYNDARTPQQMEQRALFKFAVGFAAKACQVLRIGLHVASLNARMTEYNYFMRINKKCWSLDDADGQPTVHIDYENLVLADGPVAPVAFGVPQMLDEVTMSVDFEKNPLRRTAKSEDLVYLVAYCPELGYFELSSPTFRRRDKVIMSFNDYWIGREVQLWGFVVDSAGRASTSQYIGTVEIAYPRFQPQQTINEGVTLDSASMSYDNPDCPQTEALESSSEGRSPVPASLSVSAGSPPLP
ncbi:MAG: hypothetical protein J6031_07730 [Bacteroidales bacterium]|nr:hypothetical protein [Bacteroidales bacterium]